MAALPLQVRNQRAAVQRQARFQRAAGQFDECRQQVRRGNTGADPAGAELPRCADQQRHPCGHFIPVHFVPEAALAEHVAVVTGKHDDGVIDQPGIFEGLQEFADVAVDIAARAEIGATGIADLIHRQRLVPQVVDLEQTLRMRIEVMRVRGCRQRDIGIVVQIPESLGNGVRIVRVSHRNGQAERLVAILADMVEQVLLGLEHHLFVEIQLIGAYARAGLQHR
ncbi:hypothetical protein D9M71_136080 [compost metagenome]